ncbi:MAG: hypothetical protein ACR2N3_02275 [Pyrinomonadaceae bacterium]
MNIKTISGLILILFSALTALAQTAQPSSPTPTRPRMVSGNPSPTPTPRISPTPYLIPSPTPAPKVVVVTTNLSSPSPTPIQTPRPIFTPTPTVTQVFPTPTPLPVAYKVLSYGQLRDRINEAKRLMQTRPTQTALTDSFLATDIVRLAFYDWKAAQIDFIVLTKSVFLARDTELPVISSNGRQVRVRIVRANGVNTAVTIFDENNQPQTPLVVQYPIEKNGALAETAYYVSCHPGIATPEVVGAGKLYVRNTIDIAREKLREKGIFISPQIADIAERLSTVEHIDHQRFWTEYQPQLFNEIFSLYALNEGATYRYSVSRAGAGGMVQMIPSTYAMMQSRYYNVGLIPDFVEGMRNHVNAAEAMLLYMQMTWNDLSANETILLAMMDGTATQAELMAAGYNSNPARLAGYINRGGANWKTLIPAETKVYLQIYSSLEHAVPMSPRTK